MSLKPIAHDVARKRKRPLLSSKFVQAMLAGHSALGLAFAALIYIVCLTGTLSVFLPEFHRWEQPNAPLVTEPVSAKAITEAAWAAHGQALIDDASQDIFLSFPSAYNPRFVVNYFNSATRKDGEWVADGDGRLVMRVVAPFADFLGELHTQLHLPRTLGFFIVGLTGVALLSSLISGLLAHPRIFKDAFALRWGGSNRLQQADLHNRLGVWGLPFHFVVSLSGALLGLSTLIVGVLAMAAYNGDSDKAFAAIRGPQPIVTGQPGPIPEVGPMIADVLREKPDARLVSIHFQRIATSGQLVYVKMRTPGHLAFGNTYYFDGNGKRIGQGGLEDGGVGQQILGVLQPLHFGWFDGIAAKILYAVLGLALTIVTQSGVAIWLARRRDKGRPAERWERIWSGLVWGQPLALAITATAALFTGRALVLIYLAVTIADIVIAVSVSSASLVKKILQGLTAATLACVAGVHFYKWFAVASDPASYWIDAGLLVAAAIFLVLTFRTRRVTGPSYSLSRDAETAIAG
ncbi:PepSY-associated TM helix domain-containing protein [Hyphomicrobium sp.]|jgi:uncharacterized iron-regulated membrane protein|uniref:PepSY-associated TM helix domain-containing protein n=1 Tax=Hyphomicrobium sp. TaxID=82 RepID=UPI002C78E5A0|nr:PepSY-associated TM helix domain-containing protein [Hyphomicrobium sp.]HVZ04071.1 PepSY-associated TM helix domain-containing protein [Hyphomicrobium sp.]